MIKIPVRIETSAVYLKIVDSDDRLICFIGIAEDSSVMAKQICEALNGKA